MRRLSIRWRITLWNTLAFAVILFGFGTTVYWLLLDTHYDQVDRTLATRLGQIQADPQLSIEGNSRLKTLLGHDDAYAHLLGAARTEEGQWVVAAGGLSERDLAALARHHHSAPRNESFPDFGRARLHRGEVTVAGQPLEVLLLADLEHMDEEMDLVLRSLLLTTPLAILLSAAVAYFLAAQSLAPVQQLRQRADQITAADLHQRLPVFNSHDELGRLAQTMNSMISRIERSFLEIQRFTADASHELRTPIAVIRSEAEIGSEQTTSDDQVRQRFVSILEECDRLGRLTEQLLALCREDSGLSQMEFAEVDLSEVVSESAEAMRPLADEKGLQMEVAMEGAGHGTIRGDAQRLRQLTVNLIDNAIKYTPPEGRIRITLKAAGGRPVLAVEDTGNGIPADQHQRIFERFYRINSPEIQKQEGSGLGLCIVQSIATAHGARVALRSEEGTGSTFSVHF